jgi:hypothetical protein
MPLSQVQFPWMALANANKHVPSSSSSSSNGTTATITTTAPTATVADAHSNHSLTHPTEAVPTVTAAAVANGSSGRMHATVTGNNSKDRRFWEVKKIDPSHTGVSLSAAQKHAHIKVNITTTTPISIYM